MAICDRCNAEAFTPVPPVDANVFHCNNCGWLMYFPRGLEHDGVHLGHDSISGTGPAIAAALGLDDDRETVASGDERYYQPSRLCIHGQPYPCPECAGAGP